MQHSLETGAVDHKEMLAAWEFTLKHVGQQIKT